MVASFEEFGQGVLQEREPARLVGDIRHHLRLQAGLRADPDPFRRPSDRHLELIGRERRHGLGLSREQLAEPRVHERPVVEVGSKGRDNPDAAIRIDAGDPQRFEHQLPVAFARGEREEFLELIDDEHDFGVAGHDQIEGIEEATGTGLEGVAET